MSADLLRPPAHLTNAEVLRLSQEAPAILRKYNGWSLPYPLSLVTNDDSPEKWASLENLFYACVKTGDNKSAFACLDLLKDRFGPNNERVMGLTGIYHEAVSPDAKANESILKQYEGVISEQPTNFIVRKRHIAFLKSLGKPDGAIAALVDLLDVSPIDAEAWSELAELYAVRGMYSQAIHCVEEVLLMNPNAWNMHARLGELLYLSTLATANGDAAVLRGLARSLKSFSRSVELCDDYLRGYYGIKLLTNKLRDLLTKVGESKAVVRELDGDELAPPSLQVILKLNELATSKLALIIRKASTGEAGWGGYEESEVIAARELLDRDAPKGPK